MTIVNQFSFVVLAIFVGLILGVVLCRLEWLSRNIRLGLMAAYILATVGVHLLTGYQPSPAGENMADIEATIDNGQPTFMMFYSNY